MSLPPTEVGLNVIGAILAWVMVSYAFVGDSYPLIFGESFYIAGTVVYALFEIYRTFQASVVTPISLGRVWLIIPVLIGLLAFTRLTRYRWAARYPVVIMSGIGIGLFFGLNLRAQILDPIAQTIGELATAKPDLGSSIVMFVGVITVLTYFLYSARYSNVFHEKSGRLYYVMRLGRLIFMVSIGYLIAFIMQLAFRQVSDVIWVAGKRIVDMLTAVG
jgi:hypothetical protein